MLQARTYTFKCTNTRREQDESSKTFLIYSTRLKDKCKHQFCFRRHFNHWINDVKRVAKFTGCGSVWHASKPRNISLHSSFDPFGHSCCIGENCTAFANISSSLRLTFIHLQTDKPDGDLCVRIWRSPPWICLELWKRILSEESSQPRQ